MKVDGWIEEIWKSCGDKEVVRRVLLEAQAQERGRCLTQCYPIPIRAIQYAIGRTCQDRDIKVVERWLDDILTAIREQEADDDV